MINIDKMSGYSKLSEIAAKWFIRMQEASPDSPERSCFEAWLMQNPSHQQEYASISQAWNGIDSMDELKKLAHAKHTIHVSKKNKRVKAIKQAMRVISASFVFAIVGAISHQQYHQWQAAPTLQMTRQSQTGQIITQALEDGSEVMLNANSQIQVTYYRHQRHIDLLKGEAIFNVQKDPNRPFIVETNSAKISVLGTRFAVNKLSKLVRVSVDHGKVKVESKENASQLILQNGQVAEILSGQAVQKKSTSAADYFKFAQGAVVFNQADITEIAEVISRYRQKPVAVSGNTPDKISAVFAVKDTETFINTLPKIANITIKQHANNTVLQAK